MSMYLLGGAYIEQIVKTNERVILTATACKFVCSVTGLWIISFQSIQMSHQMLCRASCQFCGRVYNP